MLIKRLVPIALGFLVGCEASPVFAEVDRGALEAALQYLNSPGRVGRDLTVVGTPTFLAGLALLAMPQLTEVDYEAFVAAKPAGYRWAKRITLGGAVMALVGAGLLTYRAHQMLHRPLPSDPAEREKVEFLRHLLAMPLTRQRQAAESNDSVALFLIDYAEYLRLALPMPPRMN